VVSYSSAINACSKSVQWQLALQLLVTPKDAAVAAFASTLTACQAWVERVAVSCTSWWHHMMQMTQQK
jgi:hypothetical protein